MNEFTKEELTCLRDNLVVPEKHHDKSILLTAYHKLMGMIDNYCEHEWINGTYCEKCERTPTECIERGEMG